MFERFTDRARRVVVLMQEEARLLNHDWLGAEHLVLGFVHEQEGVAGKVLTDLGMGDIHQLRSLVESECPVGTRSPSGHIPFTPKAKKILELSLREALQLGHNYIGTEHMLLGLARVVQDDMTGPTATILLHYGVTPEEIRREVIAELSKYKATEPRPDPRRSVPSAETALSETVWKKPEWVTVDKEELTRACEGYLLDMHVALWGRAFDLFQKDSRREAADFLAECVLGVVEHLEAKEQ